jgi:uncharacterized protein (DUF362 family)
MLFSRRSLLYLTALVVVSFLLFRWRTTLKNLLFRRQAPPSIHPKTQSEFRVTGKALVGLVHGRNTAAMVREAVALTGGLEQLDFQAKTVLVKPNVVSGESPPATTNPEVVKAVVEMLHSAGAKKVYVGDMSALLTLPTKKNMERTGIFQAAHETGAEPVYFEDYGWVKVDLPQARFVKEAYVSEWIYRVERVINVPVIKTHRSASYSICLKNFIGATHGRQRPYLLDASHWEEIVAELNLAYVPDLNIVDGTSVMVAGGPWSGEKETPALILASRDRIAADVIGLSVIKHFGRWRQVTETGAWNQKQISRAVELGLGVKDSTSLLLKPKLLQGDNADFQRLVSSISRHALL